MSISIQEPYLSALQKPEQTKAKAQGAGGSSAFQDALNAVQNNAKDPKENSFQIGGKSYTQDEWDKLLSDFDRQAEKLREEIREEIEEREALQEAKESGAYEESEITDDQIAALFADRG
ncbi:MAG: hypothetical protein II754_04285 [Lachnospiraceae bacterium]|nr:hypothetical protein [Lachnospiraceae bacterium]